MCVLMFIYTRTIRESEWPQLLFVINCVPLLPAAVILHVQFLFTPFLTLKKPTTRKLILKVIHLENFTIFQYFIFLKLGQNLEKHMVLLDFIEWLIRNCKHFSIRHFCYKLESCHLYLSIIIWFPFSLSPVSLFVSSLLWFFFSIWRTPSSFLCFFLLQRKRGSGNLNCCLVTWLKEHW